MLCWLRRVRADDDDGSISLASTRRQNSPPVISGTPRIKARTGERYQFTARRGPGWPAAHLHVANLPGWLSFDAGSGRTSGTPRRDNVGSFGNVTISVSDGAVRKTRAVQHPRRAFLQDAVGSAALGAAGSPPAMPSAGGPFRFAEIPEIVFVRGYRETEHLGIFHLDTSRNHGRQRPAQRTAGSRASPPTSVIEGSLEGVSYDSVTGMPTYDGTGGGTATARVRLEAPSETASSEAFNIRVLAPTVAGRRPAARLPASAATPQAPRGA